MTRRTLCALLACDHALDHELPGRPVTVAGYFGDSFPPRAGVSHPTQAQPSAAFAPHAGLGIAHRLAEPGTPSLRYDDTGFAPGGVI